MIMLRSASCLLVLMLSGCGQSGALYLPDQEPKAQAAPSLPTLGNTSADDEAAKQKKASPPQP